jgi:hypothetical protein
MASRRRFGRLRKLPFPAVAGQVQPAGQPGTQCTEHLPHLHVVNQRGAQQLASTEIDLASSR